MEIKIIDRADCPGDIDQLAPVAARMATPGIAIRIGSARNSRSGQ
jgi:hypothetical protein